MTTADCSTRATVDLTGQVALVTGASSGLGRRFAVTLAAHGASVVAAARRADRLADLAAEIDAGGGHCHPVSLDVTDTERLLAVFDDVEAVFGTATILVNNASVFEHDTLASATDVSWDRHIGSNLHAPFLLTQAFAAQAPEAVRDAAGEPVAQANVVNMIDQRVRKQLFAHLLHLRLGRRRVRSLDLEVDHLADAGLIHREPEMVEGASYCLALWVEDARLRSHQDHGSHRSTVVGSSRYASNESPVMRSKAST